MKRLRVCLRIPEIMVTENGIKFSGIEGLAVVLRRLCYPNRLSDLISTFFRPRDVLSRIFKAVLSFLNTQFADLLYFDWNRITPAKFDEYGLAIQRCGAPSHDIWGFGDGTFMEISQPVVHQKVLYSGHYHGHGLKYQAIVAPDGIICHLYGPETGPTNDSTVQLRSNILPLLVERAYGLDGLPRRVYADQGYALHTHWLTPYKGINISPQQEKLNNVMKPLRVNIEWAFGRVKDHLFSFLDYRKNLKLYLQPVGLYFRVGVLLANCHTCFYGNQTSIVFGLHPPSIEEYLGYNCDN